MTTQGDTDRREALRLLLSRSSRGVLLPEEAELLREHVEAEIRAGDQARAELATMTHFAEGNKRHVQLIVPDLHRAEATIERVRRLAEVLRTANRPDGEPSPLRPTGDLILVVLDGELVTP